MSASDSKNLSIKEAFGFREGADVEVFLVDQQSDRADRLGYLRPEFGSIQRLYERFQLELPNPEGLSVFFGQTEAKPFVIKLQKDAEGNLSGSLEEGLFQATATLSPVSRYSPGVFVLTVQVARSEQTRRASAANALPDAWRTLAE